MQGVGFKFQRPATPPSFGANLVVFFITTACPYIALRSPEPVGNAVPVRRTGSPYGVNRLGCRINAMPGCSKRLKPIKRRRLPRSGRAKERPFFGSFFGRAKKEHTPRPGAKRKLDCAKPWFRKKHYKISFGGGLGGGLTMPE